MNKGYLRGFTLIELLVVMTIIGLLAGISLFAMGGARESARDGIRKADLETVRSALELYKADCNQYPASITFGGTLTGDGINCPAGNEYMGEVPQDPLTGRDYDYASTGTPPSSYTLCAALEGEIALDSVCNIPGLSCTATCSYHADNP